MKEKEAMTNENFKGICRSNFELAHFAIGLGRYHIRSGHEVTLKSVLSEIRRHPDPTHLEHLKETEKKLLEEEED